MWLIPLSYDGCVEWALFVCQRPPKKVACNWSPYHQWATKFCWLCEKMWLLSTKCSNIPILSHIVITHIVILFCSLRTIDFLIYNFIYNLLATLFHFQAFKLSNFLIEYNFSCLTRWTVSKGQYSSLQT